MKANRTWDRVEAIKKALNLKTDVEFYRLAGAKKELGAQWKSGLVKVIGAEYAFKLHDKTGLEVRWIMFGEGPERRTESVTQETLQLAQQIMALPPEKRALLEMIFNNHGVETKQVITEPEKTK